jgi:hypothetical protein
MGIYKDGIGEKGPLSIKVILPKKERLKTENPNPI